MSEAEVVGMCFLGFAQQLSYFGGMSTALSVIEAESRAHGERVWTRSFRHGCFLASVVADVLLSHAMYSVEECKYLCRFAVLLVISTQPSCILRIVRINLVVGCKEVLQFARIWCVC
jgi:hypothetical protein